MKRLVVALLGAAGVLAATSASAQVYVEARARPVHRRVYRYGYDCRRYNYDYGPCGYPRLVGDLEGGISSFTSNGPFGFQSGFADNTYLGGSWGARLGVELVPWMSIEGHYSGMWNKGKPVTNSDPTLPSDLTSGLLTSIFTAELRFTAPTRFIHPYGFIGIGGFASQKTGDDAIRAQSYLQSSSGPVVPIGVGFGVPVGAGVSMGAEFTYHVLFGESFSSYNQPAIGPTANAPSEGSSAGIFTTNFVIRARL